MNTPKIFCFINSGSPGWYNVVAMSEDGDCLAGHTSSSDSWAMHDIGINSDWKHDLYKAKYPEGYELVWLPSQELESNVEFNNAIALNKAKSQSEVSE